MLPPLPAPLHSTAIGPAGAPPKLCRILAGVPRHSHPGIPACAHPPPLLAPTATPTTPRHTPVAPAPAASPLSTPPQARPAVAIGDFALVPVGSLAADQPHELSPKELSYCIKKEQGKSMHAVFR
ncbi:hypothetical protein GUJ93_ZPchr0011g28187 [Zizania palustris]|uniref:Uncharacterized protein n=1 Tax=Zizania palustris TaxID=103762 RepID=A0A8J5WH78_ZIZPA|nr:hypothetical protein GUJ93_ZPchr0011g28187 [Zizania palustris]